jgi:hypothetical protein
VINYHHRLILHDPHWYYKKPHDIDLNLRKHIMSKDNRNEKTSSRVASEASKVLRDPKSTPAQKSIAGSALTQAPNKKK